ncbi:hypothetical protein FP2506_10421 [Fulvimarina pelagi HTCC2506]|uniref:Uncharacterized protein n=1 Tax=Fulvimarina pelagi HTCC2506 TaxID=314231 RepID=Q0G512_9HYPH|nr:hypothetical protein FP2506_10421 [Fulvimarina pelagi HTCC2506]
MDLAALVMSARLLERIVGNAAPTRRFLCASKVAIMLTLEGLRRYPLRAFLLPFTG